MIATTNLPPILPDACHPAPPLPQAQAAPPGDLNERVNNTFYQYLGIALTIYGSATWITCEVLGLVINPLFLFGMGAGLVIMVIGIVISILNSGQGLADPTLTHPPESNLDPKAIELGKGYTINETRKREIPDRIDWNALFSERDVSQVEISELLDCFDNVLGTNPRETSFDDVTIRERANLRRPIQYFVSFINARDLYYDSNTSEFYYDQLTLIMKNLILELQKPEIDVGKKYNVLKELSNAANNCAPRRLEEALRQYRYITNRPDTLDNRFREWLQNYKEDLIIRYFQNTQFHVLNDARAKVQDWGLDQTDALGARDRYRGSGGNYSASEYCQRLKENYTPAHLISVIQTKASFHEAIPLITSYLQEAYTSGDLDDDTMDKILELKKDNCTELTLFGAAWLLERMHFMDPIPSASISSEPIPEAN